MKRIAVVRRARGECYLRARCVNLLQRRECRLSLVDQKRLTAARVLKGIFDSVNPGVFRLRQQPAFIKSPDGLLCGAKMDLHI